MKCKRFRRCCCCYFLRTFCLVFIHLEWHIEAAWYIRLDFAANLASFFCIIIIIDIVRRLFLILISTFFALDFVQIIWFDIKYHHSDRLTINDHSRNRTVMWMMCRAKGELSARFAQLNFATNMHMQKHAHKQNDRHTKRKEKTRAEWEWHKKQEQKQSRQQLQQQMHWTRLHHLWRHSFVSAFKFSTNQSILASA